MIGILVVLGFFFFHPWLKSITVGSLPVWLALWTTHANFDHHSLFLCLWTPSCLPRTLLHHLHPCSLTFRPMSPWEPQGQKNFSSFFFMLPAPKIYKVRVNRYLLNWVELVNNHRVQRFGSHPLLHQGHQLTLSGSSVSFCILSSLSFSEQRVSLALADFYRYFNSAVS